MIAIAATYVTPVNHGTKLLLGPTVFVLNPTEEENIEYSIIYRFGQELNYFFVYCSYLLSLKLTFLIQFILMSV